jgi:NADH:ubiquinone oxidoreductase subunit F (NADH-binding)
MLIMDGALARYAAVPAGGKRQARRTSGTAFGLTLRELLYDYGGGSASGRPIRAVQVGGPLGAYLPESQFDMPLDYEAFAAKAR